VEAQKGRQAVALQPEVVDTQARQASEPRRGVRMAAVNALADRIARHADALERGHRSPLYVVLMRGAAQSARAGGPVCEVFPDGPGEPGSVPAGRLMAALHHLVLAGDAPELARHYPSVGGVEPPEGAWAAAEATIEAHVEEVRRLCARTVQTNEPGRSAALYGGLLWLADRHRLTIRLLELGASAGLNLHADRYRYVVGGRPLGEAGSRLCFHEPWRGLPVSDPWTAQPLLCVPERSGCDPAPIDAATPDGALRLQSYIWPDERERLVRLSAAIEIARRHPVAIETAGAVAWIERELAATRPGRLTVIWESVMRQYLPESERSELKARIEHAGDEATDERPLAWLVLEPASEDHLSNFQLTCRSWPGGATLTLADCDPHGPPVTWRS